MVDANDPRALDLPFHGRRITVREHLFLSAFWFATNFHWGALLLIMLPEQIRRMNPPYRAEALGILTGVSAVVALVVPLIAGALSDRCTSNWGRRRPFMAVGIGVNVLGLIGMALAFNRTTPVPVDTAQGALASILANPGMMLFFAAYLVVQLGNNIASAAYMGIIPDLVPEDQRGIASGYMALMSQVGTLFGGVLTGMLLGSASEAVKYGAVAVVLVAVGVACMVGLPEVPLGWIPGRLKWGEYVRSLWISPRQYPDFAWVWITRALVMLGFYAVMPYVNYYLVDVIGVPRQDVGTMAPILMGVILIAASVSGVLGGRWSDRVGRKRVVYLANGAIAVVALAFIFCRNVPSALVVGVLFGLGYGAYISVDYALGTDVLPSKSNAAKEMAVWHVAMTLPQSIAAPLGGFLLAAFGKTVVPAAERGGEPLVNYPVEGYALVFLLCSVSFGLGAYLLKNVRGAR